MNSRRQYLGTLGKALGTGSLLLPWAGKGALALPADLGPAAQLPVSTIPMPFSPEALQLRGLRRELRTCYERQHDYAREEYSRHWRSLMTEHYTPTVARLTSRPARSWSDAVALAEEVWSTRAHTRGHVDGRLRRKPSDRDDDVAMALAEAVLSLGGGERFATTGDAS